MELTADQLPKLKTDLLAIQRLVADEELSDTNRTLLEGVLEGLEALAEQNDLTAEIKQICEQIINGDVAVTVESGRLTEMVGILEQTDPEKRGREWEVMLIQSGVSKNKYHYEPDMLRQATALFEGVSSYADHIEERKKGRSVKDKVGKFVGAHYGSANVDGRMVEGVKAKFKVLAPWLQQTLLESVEQDEPDFLGFSIDADGRWENKNNVKWVTELVKVHSVDVVTDPSAGGRIMRLVASMSGDALTMDPEELKALVATTVREAVEANGSPKSDELTALQTQLATIQEQNRRVLQLSNLNVAIAGASGLSDFGASRIREFFSETIERRDLSTEEIDNKIQEQLEYEGAIKQALMPVPSATARVYMGDDSKDKMRNALIGLFQDEDIDGVPRFSTFKEAYCRWAGKDFFDLDPYELQDAFSVKYDSARDHKRIQESISTTQWGQLYADVFYLQMMRAYRASPAYNMWKAIVSQTENVPDFQTRHWARLGGYGDLDTVAESATYPMLTSPGDEEVTYAVAKRGGLDDVTFESIVNDRVGAIRRIPIAMGRSAARTLYKFVLNLATTTNPTMAYDSVTLYNSSHANTNANQALTIAGVQAMVAALRQQTAFGESLEILGERNRLKVLIVPTNLEFVARRIMNPSDTFIASIAAPGASTEIDPQAFKGYGVEVLVYDVLTDQSDWYGVANPAEVETMVVGFLNGRQDPELFVQDQPNVGANLTADKQTYKIRHIYGSVVLDHRSFYRNVAP